MRIGANMSCPTGISLTYYAPLLGTIVVLMTCYIAIKYMAAKAFKIPEWEAYVSLELYEIFISAIIVVAAVGMFRAGELFSCEIAGGSDPINTVSFFLLKIIQDVMSGMRDLFTAQVCLSMLSTFQRRIGEFVLTVTYKVFPGVDSYINITNVIGYGLVAIFGSLTAQLTLLTVIKATMATFFLPLGIVLRFFPLTRETGVFLIVLAIAAQVVFPSVYLINQKIFSEIGFDFPLYDDGFFQGTGSVLPSLCGGKYLALGFAGSEMAIGWLPPFITTPFRLIFSEFGIGMITPIEFKEIMQAVGVLTLPALFMPAFSMMITFAFVNAVTKFLLSKIG